MKIIKEKKIWDEILSNNFPEKMDIYFQYDYFNLYARNYNVKLEAIFWENEYIKIFWSHFIRDIKNIDFLRGYDYFDLSTPYGYGGPLIYNKTDKKEHVFKALKIFLKEYEKFALKEKYVCEFIRFHPFFKNWEYLKDLVNVQHTNDVVALNLTQTKNEIWNNMSKNSKRYIKKANEEFQHISIVENPSEDEISSFIALYNKTMDVQHASDKYYFSKDFITDHFRFGNLLVYCKNEEGILGSCGIFLKGNNIMHYHLGSTNYDFKSSPLRIVLWNAIKWAKQKGLKWFHFGGGRGKNDSLYDFKKGFSEITFPFYISKIIFNKNIYNKLTVLNSAVEDNSDFFPLYRIGYDKTIV